MAEVPRVPVVVEVDAWRVWPWAWVPPVRWECLRCGEWFLTRDLRPRCPECGWLEDGS